ncbi:2-C-methyl-D-erythritol 2,4-cyclodiphosphate synthase, chloroplastic-like isoform X3 [Amaranthus tricolor]|uniref:2-C-methyl-D-erythritol 2,4-cyclodiphosphate synthase, chloroplastic-like isoform X3 n=1 Tax=Amaranthus tricolor TaxID=29722 RepID=UPI002589F17C|nr:2-C-methyl-D-erythritol 2,4-cyclodiphosphate synthase, chloroplastic-like isoform X3 [Amaranthus tricolor]
MATPLYTYFFSHTIHKPQFPISSSCSYFLSHFNLKTKQLENSVINSPNSFSISAVSPISDTSRSITSSNSSKTLPFRVGHGFDLHRLEPGYPLIIGGINIPHDRGCEAHSDGDVLLHCVVDAILGALGLPDIGQIFPDNDPKWKGAPSSVFIKEALIRDHYGCCIIQSPPPDPELTRSCLLYLFRPLSSMINFPRHPPEPLLTRSVRPLFHFN